MSETRMDKAIDFLLGRFIDERGGDEEIVLRHPTHCMIVLKLTADTPHLPNRVRLLELVEQAMPKEESKP